MPRSRLQPDFSKDRQGEAASAYFGGRVEARIVREPVPCAYIDAVSMYPTVFSLLDLWFGHITPARLEPEDLDPEEIQRLLDGLRANPKRLLDREFWPQLAFFAQVEPNGTMLPTRPDIPSPYLRRMVSHESHNAPKEKDDELTPESVSEVILHRLVSIGPVESQQPLWYAGPDLANAMISGAGQPRILRAWRLQTEGMQPTLETVRFRGEDEIDPRVVNPFQRLIELRKRKSGNDLDDELRSTGYKVIANSGAYGIFVETTPEDIDPDVTREARPMQVWGLNHFGTRVKRPERHSPLCFFPTASLVTAGARLLLGFAESLVHERGGEVAYCDTDSLILTAKEHGGFIPCEYGSYKTSNDRRAIRALSWTEVGDILDILSSLNPYRTIPGSSFKLEDENLDESEKHRELWFYGSREKSYALYTLSQIGEPTIVKNSAHTIGLYSSPLPGDKEQCWITEAWTFTIRKALGLPVEVPTWFDLPALSQLTLTTWHTMKRYANTPNVHPFDFLAVAQTAYPGMLACCDAPRPSCPLFPDIQQWTKQPWRCLGCGMPINPFMTDTEQSIFKTYGRVVGQLAQAIEIKRLPANGVEPTRENMRGFTIPRPVHVAKIEHMGKEVVVDPTDTGEGLTAELLGATDVTIFHNPDEYRVRLRARIKAAGISHVARVSGVSLSQIKAIVNQGASPHQSTIRKIEATLQKICENSA